jgi:hypothetical protein
MVYEDSSYSPYSATANVSIPVKQEGRFDIGSLEIMPSDISVGDQSNVMFSIFNTGKTTLYSVWVRFEGDSISGGDTFLGNIASGATGSVDTMVTGEAATTDDGTVKAIVSYEDDAGNVYSQEQEFTLFVSDESYEDDMMYDDMMYEDEGGSGHTAAIVIVLIIIVIIAAVVVTVVILKKKKKKKEQLELEAELDEDDEV